MGEQLNPLSPDQNGEISYKGHTFFVLYPNSGKTIEQLLEYSALLIHSAHSTFASFTIQRLRAYNDLRMYLKPIFFLQPSMDNGNYINSLIDGSIFNLNQLDSIHPRIEEILTKTSQLKDHTPTSYESTLIMKLLTLAYTRGRKNIEPIPYNFSGVNYSYAGISCNFEHVEEHKVFEILELAEKEGLIKGEFYDKTHYCNQCNHGALNYRSVCPKCSSSNSETQDIVHHFPCGNVGPISDYKNEFDDALNCPKCNKQLRHIGVDYDKPSVLHFCKKCDHKFQDFEVKAKCLQCEFDNSLEELLEKDIQRYTITNKGENAAIFGYVPSNQELQDVVGTVRYDFFENMVKFEVERIRIIDCTSNIAMLYMYDAAELFSRVGKDRKAILIKEIVDEIKKFIRPYDLIAFKSSSLIVLTMNDVSIDNAALLLMEIVELVSKLIRDNVTDFDMVIDKKIQPLTTKEPYRNQIEELIAGFN
jgi:hypothetical protein